jgi:hypothetical protein
MQQGTSAEISQNFQGNIVFTEAKITLFTGEILEGTGTCQKSVCTLLGGKVQKGSVTFTDSNAIITEDGISITVGNIEGNPKVKIFDISDLTFNDDGTVSFTVKEGSEVAGWEMLTAGRVVFDPRENSIKPTIENPSEDSVFAVRSFDATAPPLKFIRNNVNIQLDTGMFLTVGSTRVAFNEKDCNGNCLLVSEKRLVMMGKGYTIRFDQNNPLVNVYPQGMLSESYAELKHELINKHRLKNEDFLWRKHFPDEMKDIVPLLEMKATLEITPTGGTIEIINRNVADPGGVFGISEESSQAPKITITGQVSDEDWAEIKNGGISLLVGPKGILRTAISRKLEGSIPLEINILDQFGKSLIFDQEGNSVKASIDLRGNVFFSSSNAKITPSGSPDCGSFLNFNCNDDYLKHTSELSSRAAIETALEEYTFNRERPHDFKPEYSRNLDSIVLFAEDWSWNVRNTQLEILENLPDYTKIKIIVEPDVFLGREPYKDFFKARLPEEVYSRITFLEAPQGLSTSPWAQDLSEGDEKVQILPLSYTGGFPNTPDKPQNEIMYKLEEEGIEIRRVPVEFAGGNIFVSRDKEGRKLLLAGGDSYLFTAKSYELVGKSISEDEYSKIMKNAFNVDEVVIIATRDESGKINPQPSSIFHIDQVMLPIADGVVAMPSIEILPQTEEKEIFQKIKTFAAEQYYGTATEARDEVNKYREMMTSLGYTIVDLKTGPESVEDFQAYTNGIVYQDKNTRQKTVIMPIFPNDDGVYLMGGTNLENKKAFEDAGFVVKTVKDRAYIRKGNIHCLTILAQNSQTCPNCDLSLT